MQKMLTQEVVRKFSRNCNRWFYKGNHKDNFNCFGNNIVLLSQVKFREYMDKLLSYLVDQRIGTDTEVDLGHYRLISRSDLDYIVVKPAVRHLPKLPGSYVGWVDWDIKMSDTEEGRIVDTKFVDTIYAGRAHLGSRSSLGVSMSCVHISILSQVLLQCLFNIDGEVDLSKKPLPKRDVCCQVGKYVMVHDLMMQEWRIWKKS